MVCDECKPEFDKLLKRIEELEKKLLAYENAHTPSSKIRFPPRIINENKQPPGQKIGHIGITRTKPNPTMTIEICEENCPHCKAKLKKPFKVISKIIEEIPKPQPIEVTEYKINHYICPKCKKEVVAKAPIPEKSSFGSNAMAHITLLKFEDRLPLRKVCSTMSRQFNFPVSSGTVFEITDKVSEVLYADYKKIIVCLRRSKSVNVDETEIRVGGLNYHLWVFTTKKVTLYVIRKSRGKNVIQEILGEHYKGIIGCDGWTSYASYSTNLQRCWAHLLREAKYLAQEHSSAKSLYEGLKTIYEKATGKKEPSKDNLILEMKQWVDYAESYRELRKFAVKISNGIDFWFTFLGKKYIEPTNNRAERALRELIVQRKIIGTLRNDKGATIMERITTCIATWKQLGLNTFAELKARLC
jgi:transposase